MAGHSQFKNIMHRKGRQDAAKSKLFGKLAREITVSAKLGLPDPGMNPRLRAAIIAARAENMPKDNIERAIKKATPRATTLITTIKGIWLCITSPTCRFAALALMLGAPCIT